MRLMRRGAQRCRPALLLLAAALSVACAAPRPRGASSGSSAAPAPHTTSAGAAASASDAPDTPPAPGALAAAFSQDSAWKHLEAQLSMGPRGNGLPGHARLEAYLKEHLVACGALVSEQRFQYVSPDHRRHPAQMANIVGTFKGTSERWILLGTHYDTRLWADEDPDASRHDQPIEGADDGASGTAVLLAVAEVLKGRTLPVGVELVFFDGEDFGRPGSEADYFVGSTTMVRHWSDVHGASRPDFVVVLDMVGDADLAFSREAKSQGAFPWLNDHIWRAGRALAPAAFPEHATLGVTDDHDAFMEMGIPSTLLIDLQYPWWHQAGDTEDKCAPASLGITGRVLLTAVLDAPPPVPPSPPR